jgi:hypothetical protein
MPNAKADLLPPRAAPRRRAAAPPPAPLAPPYRDPVVDPLPLPQRVAVWIGLALLAWAAVGGVAYGGWLIVRMLAA